jgi:adenine specific DNA methylase Mod
MPRKNSANNTLSLSPDQDCGHNQPGLVAWEKLLIHGENLLALRYLCKQERLSGRIRLVYIDPPFATNQDFIYRPGHAATVSRPRRGLLAYHDRLTGEEYLDFLRQRLQLLRELLAADGSIYVHIDCKNRALCQGLNGRDIRCRTLYQ